MDPVRPADRVMRSFVQLIAVAAAAYGVFLVLVYLFQAKLIYFPNFDDSLSRATPRDVGLEYEDVQFRTADGLLLHGWFVPAHQARGVLLFMHGNAGNITHRLDSIRLFNRLGLSVFIFDYRGYGRSEGRPSEQGTYRDAEAAWRFLVEDRGVRPDEIVLFGRSLGASIAAKLAGDTQPSALIIESAFTSAPDLAARYYWYLPVRALARFRYDTRSHVARVSCPVLVAHSVNDEIVPVEHGRLLFEAASEPKTFLEMNGGHNDGFVVSGERYTQGLSDFIKRNLHASRP